METLKCFNCNIEKPLAKFKENKRVYQTKASKGRCLVCKLCSFVEALDKLAVVRYNYETNSFEIKNFDNKAQVIDFFDKEGGEL